MDADGVLNRIFNHQTERDRLRGRLTNRWRNYVQVILSPNNRDSWKRSIEEADALKGLQGQKIRRRKYYLRFRRFRLQSQTSPILSRARILAGSKIAELSPPEI